jgi:hypothetical protein
MNRRAPFRRSTQCLAWIAPLAVLATAAPARAQVVTYPRSIVDSIANKIRADGEFIESLGRASVDFATARKIRAEAYEKELDNVLKYAQTYWARRDLYEAEKLERYISPLERRRIRDSKTWKRLKDHPDLNVAAIATGSALNFLLDRLAGSVLAYYSLSELDSKLLEQLKLSDETLHRLRLEQQLPSGRRHVFRADEGVGLDVDWWPFALRDDELAPLREEFVEARDATVEEAKEGSPSEETLKRLMRALDELDAAFRTRYTRERRLVSLSAFDHYRTAERFLKSLAGEIHLVQAAGNASVFDGSLKFEGDNLFDLLTHMSRHGLHFAPAQPGDESAYHEVFRMMRDLYVTVADEYLANVSDAANKRPR